MVVQPPQEEIRLEQEERRAEPEEEQLVPILEVDEDGGQAAERDPGRRQGVRRDPRPREARDRAGGEAPRAGLVGVLDASSVIPLDRTLAI